MPLLFLSRSSVAQTTVLISLTSEMNLVCARCNQRHNQNRTGKIACTTKTVPWLAFVAQTILSACGAIRATIKTAQARLPVLPN